MKIFSFILISFSLISCTPGGNGNDLPQITFNPITLPPQWTETFTRQPTLPEPTATHTSEPTSTDTPTVKPPTLEADGTFQIENILAADSGAESIVGIDYLARYGKIVSISDMGVVCIWDANSGEVLLRQETGSSGWASVLFDPNGYFFVLGLKDRIEIRNTETGEIKKTIRDNLTERIQGMAFFPSKELMAATWRYGIQLFTNISDQEDVRPKRLDSYYQVESVTRPVFNPDGTKVGYGGTYNEQPALHISYLDYCSSGFCFNGGKGGTLYGKYGPIVDLQFTIMDGLVVASQNSVTIYDSSDNTIAHAEIPNLANIALSENNILLVSSTTDGKLTLMNFQSLEVITEIQAHEGRINQLILNSEWGRIVTAGEDGKIQLWQLR